MTSEKECSTCGATKPLDEFGLRKGRPDGREARCKACRNKAQNARYASDQTAVTSAGMELFGKRRTPLVLTLGT